MTRLGARLKLRELLGSVEGFANDEFDGAPDIEDAIRLLAVREGGSEELLEALVARAGLSPLMPLEAVFLDEEDPA